MLIGSRFIGLQCRSTFTILPIEPEAAVQDLASTTEETEVARRLVN